MKKGDLQIHSQNILPIIKKWLYSEKDIFIRELVSNACDALTKLSIIKNNSLSDARIEIKIDEQAKTITISDTGIGLDADEAEKYLAQIAFSGAEEFVKAYQTNDAFIGHFGLGFYSAFMVASVVEVQSLSYKEGAESIIYRSDGSTEYTIDKGNKAQVGTDIILHINEENSEYLDQKKILEILKRYCQFLPFPIFLNESCINSKEPIWIKVASDCTQEEYRDFYQVLYPFEEEPLFWMHLNVDYPFHLKGVLYFPRIKKDFDFTKSHVKLYSNRVFVSDDCKDILPEYLSMLKGVIDSPDIPLNVSRSYLQVDKTVRQLANHISKKVVDALGVLYRNERERFYACWPDVEAIVKLGLLHDDKNFARAKEFLLWKTPSGNWLSLSDYIAQNKEKTNNKIFYTQADTSHELLSLYAAKGIDLFISTSPLDTPLFALLEKDLEGARFVRIDADTDILLDPSKEKTILNEQGKTEATLIADFVRGCLSDVTVEAKSFASQELPCMLSQKEEERRLRDYLTRIAPDGSPAMKGQKTFIVNTNSPVITKLFEVQKEHPELAQMMVQQLYHLAHFSQKEFDPSQSKSFVSESYQLLDTISSKLVQPEAKVS